MLAALTVLMFHVAVAPQNLALTGATAAVGTAAVVLAGAAAAPAKAPEASFTPASEVLAMEAPAATESVLDSEPQPAPAVAYTPGVLTPQPVAAVPLVTGEPAAVRPIDSDLPISEADDRNARRLWMGLSIAQHGAAAFDAWSTRRVIASGAGQELNPFLHPFAGNASLYAAVQVAPAILDYVGHRMMYSQHGWARRTWWVPQALATTMSVIAGVHNMGVYSPR